MSVGDRGPSRGGGHTERMHKQIVEVIRGAKCELHTGRKGMMWETINPDGRDVAKVDIPLQVAMKKVGAATRGQT